MKLYISISLLLVFSSCVQHVKPELSVGEDTSYYAWKHRDSAYFRRLILGLQNDQKDDFNFFGDAATIGSEAGFYYGCLDPTDSFWTNKSGHYRVTYRKNVSSVYELYLNSCLFMQMGLEFDSTKFLQEEDTLDLGSRLLTSKEKDAIKNKIESLCRK
ncbi:hypothetical protein L3C95_32930 [Chitinophaga filiformis]|uniref:hypothetical protein n=1 Tax=Chitinophaga filiformis TaxID=104663 RepID=UPI001F33C871|nr:hypothetical protein [Chitinophaga filiformis]MCF6407738.1 hypothetical protein [Chitinophaga filiformis]